MRRSVAEGNSCGAGTSIAGPGSTAGERMRSIPPFVDRRSIS